jgi:hypothetical protein
MPFMDVKNDIAFHMIFGNENKKIIPLSFLNAVMRLKGEDVHFKIYQLYMQK